MGDHAFSAAALSILHSSLADDAKRQAYWAALSFTDDNVGAIVDAAKAVGLYDDAIIVLWGDHGRLAARQ